jgi:hypothetical protein
MIALPQLRFILVLLANVALKKAFSHLQVIKSEEKNEKKTLW